MVSFQAKREVQFLPIAKEQYMAIEKVVLIVYIFIDSIVFMCQIVMLPLVYILVDGDHN